MVKFIPVVESGLCCEYRKEERFYQKDVFNLEPIKQGQ